MDAIINLLSGSLGKDVVEGIKKNTGASTGDIQSVVSAALPTLFAALQSNAGSSEGAQGILSALANKHDGSVLNNVSGFLGSTGTGDGDGILQHMLGGQRGSVEQAISSKTGVSPAIVSKVLSLLAPIVMGYLGKQTRSQQVTDGGGLGSLLGSLIGGKSGGSGNLLGSLLDQNGDGKLGMEDLGGLLSGFLRKK